MRRAKQKEQLLQSRTKQCQTSELPTDVPVPSTIVPSLCGQLPYQELEEDNLRLMDMNTLLCKENTLLLEDIQEQNSNVSKHYVKV